MGAGEWGAVSRKAKKPDRAQPAFLAVDFFCGAGGTTRGLIDAGGYVIAGIDKALECRKTYLHNNTNASLDKAAPHYLDYDIFPPSETNPDGGQDTLFIELDCLISEYEAMAPQAPLLFAICAPCQPFTKLSRKELSTKRIEVRKRDSHLLREAVKFVELFKPELVLSENVSGIAEARYGGIWEEFRCSLEDLGYATGTKVVCTSRFGIAQFRKRSILLAARRECVKSESFADLTAETLLVPESDPDAVMLSVREVLQHLPAIGPGQTHPTVPNHRSRDLSSLNRQRLSSAAPGESNAYMERTQFGDLSLACHQSVNKRLKTRCFGDVYTRMHPDKPSPTITTKCHSISNGRFGHYDTAQIRGISLREAAILQSFPENYVFYPDDQIEPVARMIGNAVPPKLAAFYSGYLVNTIDTRRRI
jgi:DNA (cytosine-5)-methyltransferase 1